MAWVAAAVIGSAAIGAYSSNKAAKGQARASDKASDLQQVQYEQTRQDNEPWRVAGQNALANLTGILNSGKLSTRFTQQDFTNDPGYQFALKEGQRAIGNQANAMGGVGLGSMRRAASFAEGNANQFYDAAFNRWRTQNNDQWGNLSQLAGLGNNANASNANAGNANATNQGNLLVGASNAAAGNAINQGNIYGNAINQLGAYWNRGADPNAISQYGLPNYAVMPKP